MLKIFSIKKIKTALEKIKNWNFKSVYFISFSIIFILIFVIIVSENATQAFRNQEDKASLHFEKIMNSYRKNQSDSALVLTQKLLESRVLVDSANLIMGNIALNEKRWSQAEKHFRAILRKNIQAVNAAVGLAAALKGQGNLESAIQTYRSILFYQPENLTAQIGLANALLEKAEPDSAKNISLDDAIEAAPYFLGILKHPLFLEKISLNEYIQFFANLSRFAETPFESELYNSDYILKSAIAKNIQMMIGEQSGAIDLTEALFSFYKREPDRGETHVLSARKKNPALEPTKKI
mgnify:FL=1